MLLQNSIHGLGILYVPNGLSVLAKGPAILAVKPFRPPLVTISVNLYKNSFSLISVSICYDQKIIMRPKTSHIQIIPGIFPAQAIIFAPGKIYTGLTWAGNHEKEAGFKGTGNFIGVST